MKKVLVIKGRSAYNVLRKAADEIAEGFRAYGCETEVLDTQTNDFLVRLSGCTMAVLQANRFPGGKTGRLMYFSRGVIRRAKMYGKN